MVSEHEWLHGKPYEEAFADGDVAWSEEVVRDEVSALQELVKEMEAEKIRGRLRAAWDAGHKVGAWEMATGDTGERNPYE